MILVTNPVKQQPWFSAKSMKEITVMDKMTKQFDDETITSITRRRRKDAHYYRKSVWRSAEISMGFNKSQTKQDYLKYLMEDHGTPAWIPACNVPARLLLSKLLAKAMLNLHHQEPKPKGMRLYHATLVFPDFLTGDRTTSIDWPKVKKRVATLMRRLGPNFIGVGEVDVLLNKSFIIDGVSQGRTLCPHFHVLFWTDEPIQTLKLAEQLSKPFGTNSDGMKVVKITRCKDTEVDVTRLASYLFKAPQGGKTQWMDKEFDRGGALTSVKVKQFSSSKSHRKIVFSRLAEIQSHIDIRSLIISGGEGVALKKQLIAVLVATTKLLGTSPPDRYGYDRTISFWEAMRAHGVGGKYKTPAIKF
jgi:hypothetical protein